MPNNPRQQAMYVITGDPETVNSSNIPFPGTLGRFVVVKNPTAGNPVAPGDENGRDKGYAYVKVDSVMTIAPYRGAVAWWADQSQYLVTTDPSRQGRGNVAGVFKSAVTRGNYCYIQRSGPSIVSFNNPVTAAPTSAGLNVIPSAEQAHADCLAAGTAPTYPLLGRSISAYDTTNYTATVDLSLGEVL